MPGSSQVTYARVRDQRSTSGVMHHPCPPSCLRQSLSLNLELADFYATGWPVCSRNLPPSRWDYRCTLSRPDFYMDVMGFFSAHQLPNNDVGTFYFIISSDAIAGKNLNYSNPTIMAWPTSGHVARSLSVCSPGTCLLRVSGWWLLEPDSSPEFLTLPEVPPFLSSLLLAITRDWTSRLGSCPQVSQPCVHSVTFVASFYLR